jgi:hypothetical protein
VFDLLDEAPDKVLHKLYSNLERLKHDGDALASEIYRTLRLIVSTTRQFHRFLANIYTIILSFLFEYY